MIKEIKTEKFDGLAVLVPDGFKGGIANMGYLIGKADNPATMIHEKHFNSPFDIQKQLDRVNKLPEFVMLPAIKIPEGEYKILGRADKLTEEQCAEIMHRPVPIFSSDQKQIGENYLSGSAKTDFDNLLHYIHGCYAVNPYEKFKDARLVHAQGSVITGEKIIEEVNRKYDEAQLQTGTWVILQKLTS